MLRRLTFLLFALLANPGLIPAASAQQEMLELASRGETQTVLDALTDQTLVGAMQADGTSLLHWAVYYDDLTLAKRLLELGADAQLQNNYGASPMAQAAIVGNPDMLEALLEAGVDPNERYADGQTALMILARTNNLRAAELLLEAGADVNMVEQFRGQTALMWAAAQKQAEMLKLLLEHGADPNARSSLNNWQRQVTAEPRLKVMPVGGLTPLLYAAREGCTLCTLYLIEAGADIQMTDPEGISPLIMACLNAHWDSARLLLEAGAYIDKWDIYGRSPLYATVDYNTIPHGGRVDKVSSDLTSSFEFLTMLLEAGANPNLQLKLLPPFRELSLDRAARGDRLLLIAGTSSLIRAARGADVEAIEILLEHGALIDLPNDNDVTALIAAAGYGQEPGATRGRFRTQAEALLATRALLANGAADINHQDNTGITALHAAADQGWADIVALLLEYGADPAIEDSFGTTALDYALGRGGRFNGGGGGNVSPETAALLDPSVSVPGSR
tara:strand:+ start:842 stop:2350 length:1509 start_codon:yes stop_codon:yes gene_type:complete